MELTIKETLIRVKRLEGDIETLIKRFNDETNVSVRGNISRGPFYKNESNTNYVRLRYSNPLMPLRNEFK